MIDGARDQVTWVIASFVYMSLHDLDGARVLLGEVREAQKDLVEILHTLRQVVCVKR